MNALALYHDLKARGVILEACDAGERLKVDTPAGVVSAEDRAALLEFKPVLLELLAQAHEKESTRRSEARWSAPRLISILDPFTGEWHEWPAARCLPGVVTEADRRRKGDPWK